MTLTEKNDSKQSLTPVLKNLHSIKINGKNLQKKEIRGSSPVQRTKRLPVIPFFMKKHITRKKYHV
jgi:hypothetical protein